MTTNSFARLRPTSKGLWATVGLPLAGLVVLLTVDINFIPGIFALPTLLMMFLIYLGLRLPPQIIALWALAYVAVILLITFLPIQDSVTNPIYRPYVRTAIFLTGSTAAVLLAGFRQRLQAGHEALFRVISALPLAVIVSDVSGKILLLNDQARRVLGRHLDPEKENSFFDLFTNPGQSGKAVAEYIGCFDSRQVGTTSALLQTRNLPPLSLRATITPVSVDGRRYAVTMIERAARVVEEPVSAI